MVSCCVRIFTTTLASGSGILMIDSNYVYIVTAAHVAQQTDINSFIKVDGNDHQPISIDLKAIV